MAQNVENTFPSWLHYFDTIESTNNYAMKLVDDGLAQHGTVISAGHQSLGKGQRGKKWENGSGNVMMSLIVKPVMAADKQFNLSMVVATTIAKYLQTLNDQWQVAIKWPNDIYINDKKACGILIENIFRGMQWTYAVVGIGMNVNQTLFPPGLTNAISLSLAANQHFDLLEIVTDLRSGLLNSVQAIQSEDESRILKDYNHLLFCKQREVTFEDRKDGRRFQAFVQEVNQAGQLLLLSHKGIELYNFGELEWMVND